MHKGGEQKMTEVLLVADARNEGPLGWQERGLCTQTDPEAFFPEKGGSTREAKKVCLSCEVRPDCLEYALESDESFGVWGGLSVPERRRLKRQIAPEAAKTAMTEVDVFAGQ